MSGALECATTRRPPDDNAALGIDRVNNLPQDLSRKLWLWLPLSLALPIYGVGAWCKYRYPIWSEHWWREIRWYEHWFHGESGSIEIASVILLLIAIGLGVASVKGFPLGFPWVKRWLMLLVVATVYFAGEEVSWGQHLFGWETPQWYQATTENRQMETNLHNINSWLNQKPRILFTLWVVIGGIVVPLRCKLKGHYSSPTSDWRYWFWPTWVCSLTAILVILVKLPEWMITLLHIQDDVLLRRILIAPPSETQELYLALFLLVYFGSMVQRTWALRRQPF